MKTIGILTSETTVAAGIDRARAEKRLYAFRGARGMVAWPVGHHAHLGPSGAVHFLWRWGIPSVIVSEKLFVESSASFHTLILAGACVTGEDFRAEFGRWLDAGGRAIVAGETDLPPGMLGMKGFSPASATPPGGYRVLSPEPHPPAGTPLPCCPADYPVATGGPSGAAWVWNGNLAARTDRTFWTGVPVFDTVGALIQGHIDPPEDFGPASLYWLDGMMVALRKLLEAGGFGDLWDCTVAPWEEPTKVIILRHDLDFTRDTTYFDREKSAGLPATFSVRDDANLAFWKSVLATYPAAEVNYHFDSVIDRYPLFRRVLSKAGIARIPDLVAPDFKAVSGDGIARSFLRGGRALGKTFRTAFKHGSTFLYPETVDALDKAFEAWPDLLGVSTVFRWTLHRYAAEADIHGGGKRIVAWPGTPVPFWFPLRMWNAHEGRTLGGWDITCVNEPAPEHTDALLDAPDTPPWGVYTFNFHPGHTHGSPYRDQGCAEWFDYLIAKAQSAKYVFRTCADVFERMNRWCALLLYRDGDGYSLTNEGASEFPSCRVVLNAKTIDAGNINPGRTVRIK